MKLEALWIPLLTGAWLLVTGFLLGAVLSYTVTRKKLKEILADVLRARQEAQRNLNLYLNTQEGRSEVEYHRAVARMLTSLDSGREPDA